ncbi:homocysteine methyltransferase [Neisseria meningitidis]|nr:homocysteine methyltransferase [Neisseria meningitidis]
MLYFKRKLILCVFFYFSAVFWGCVDLPYAVPDRLCLIIRRDGLIY